MSMNYKLRINLFANFAPLRAIKAKSIFFMIFISIIFISRKKKAYPYNVHISGKVVDAITQQSIPGAEIGGGGNGGSSNFGPTYTTSDADGNYTFDYPTEQTNLDDKISVLLRHAGYGAYTRTEDVLIPNMENVSNYNLQIHPNTYFNIIVSKTNLTDTMIQVLYTEPTWVQNGHVIYVSNISSPDTLTLVGSYGMNSKIYLKVTSYNTWSPSMQNLGTQYSYSYDIYCGSVDTTQYHIQL